MHLRQYHLSTEFWKKTFLRTTFFASFTIFGVFGILNSEIGQLLFVQNSGILSPARGCEVSMFIWFSSLLRNLIQFCQIFSFWLVVNFSLLSSLFSESQFSELAWSSLLFEWTKFLMDFWPVLKLRSSPKLTVVKWESKYLLNFVLHIHL